MNGVFDNLIEAVQASGYKAVIVVSGGGSGAVHALLSHPGASRFVLEAQVPYSPEAMFDYLGETPVSACSEETVRLMAEKALDRASRFTDHASHATGIACTAALQTNRKRKGNDRAFVCIKSREKEIVQELELSTGSRSEQEEAVSSALLSMVAEFMGREKA